VSPDNTVEYGLSELLHQSGDPTQDVLTAASVAVTQQVAQTAVTTEHLKMSASTLLGKVSATPLGQSNIVVLQAQAGSAAEAQMLANTFANAVITTRNANLRKELNQEIPVLKAQTAGLSAADAAVPGSASQTLSVLEQLVVTGDPTLTIDSQAQLPTSPSSPKTKLSLAAGLLGGLVIGIGAAFGFAAVDPRLRREEQIREIFPGVPVLARIPNVGGSKKLRPLVPGELSLAALEGYRTLRTTLASRASRDGHAFLVTGSAPAEGKTTSAIGLSVALAQGGARVMLVEADLRRPTIASALGVTVKYGTEQVLIGEVDLATAMVSLRVDGAPLRVLAAHRSGVELADRLSLPVARRLIQAAKEEADFVVIDSPPLTTVIDALPLAQLADDVVVVARMGESRLNKLADLEELLANQGAAASGVVLVGSTLGRFHRYDYYQQESEPEQGRRSGGDGTVRLRPPAASRSSRS
jgi:succinoglycan biosynthesis transport protein ExoP